MRFVSTVKLVLSFFLLLIALICRADQNEINFEKSKIAFQAGLAWHKGSDLVGCFSNEEDTTQKCLSLKNKSSLEQTTGIIQAKLLNDAKASWIEETTESYNLCALGRSNRVYCQAIHFNRIPGTILALQKRAGGMQKITLVFKSQPDGPDAENRLAVAKSFLITLKLARGSLKTQMAGAGEMQMQTVVPIALIKPFSSAPMLRMTSAAVPQPDEDEPVDPGDGDGGGGGGGGDGGGDPPDDGDGGAAGDPPSIEYNLCKQRCYDIYDNDAEICRNMPDSDKVRRNACWVALSVAQGQCISDC